MHYFRKKLFHLIPVFFLVTFGSFALLNVLPGDVIDALLIDEDSSEAVSVAERESLIKELGLDKPVVIRYALWLGDLVQGDLGRSVLNRKPVTQMIIGRFPVTIQLLIMGQVLGLLIAAPLGIASALKSNKPLDRWLSTIAYGIIAAPGYVIAVVFIYVFAVILQWLTAAGHTPFFENVGDNIRSFTLPAIVIAIGELPILMRVLRVDMIATLQQDYIALAKAKGLSTRYVLFRHALRPSSFTLVTIVGLQIGGLISGLVILETIFGLPGMGRLLIDAIDSRDAMVVQGLVTFFALVYVLINFSVDMFYAVLDPRVARSGRAAG